MSDLLAPVLFAASVALIYQAKSKNDFTPIINRPRRVSSSGVPFVPDTGSPLTQLQEFEKSRSRVYYFFRETDLDRGIDYSILCIRPLGLLRAAKDIILLPDHPQIRYAFSGFVKFLGYEEWQVIWIADTDEPSILKDGTAEEHITMLQTASKRLQEIYEKPKDFLVIPYIVTENLYEACQQMKLTVMGDRIACIPNKASIYELVVPEGAEWAVPNGVVCTAEELLEQYEALTADSKGEAQTESKVPMEQVLLMEPKKYLIKPCNGQGGNSISKVSTYAETEAAMKEYIAAQQKYQDTDMSVQYGMMSDVNAYNLEEEVQGVQKTVVVVSVGATVVAVSDQMANGFTHIGNAVPSTVDQHVLDVCVESARAIQAQINLQGFWGLDFVIAPGPNGKLRPVVVDLNVGRLCGGHYPYLFAKNNGVTFKSYVSLHVPDSLSEEDRLKIKETVHNAGVWKPESGVAYAALNRRIEYVLDK